jgi:alpha-tubulin suppressor-like RCC1 family protein
MTWQLGAIQMATGDGHNYVIQGQDILAWGDNAFGQLGQGNADPIDGKVTITGASFISVSAGAHHGLALDASGVVWTWGNNDFGQLGKGDTLPQSSPSSLSLSEPAVAVYAGGFSSYVLGLSGEVYAFGRNHMGQLGLGDQNDASTPSPLGAGVKFSKLSIGSDFVLAMDAQGMLWSWGSNGFGQLGLGNSFTQNFNPTPTQAVLNEKLLSIHAGGFHGLAISRTGNLYGWGKNLSGQVSPSDPTDLLRTPSMLGTGFSRASAGRQHSALIDSSLGLTLRGKGNEGQLSTGNPVGAWMEVSSSAYHNLAMKKDGSIHAWGLNDRQQVSQDANKIINTPTSVGLPTLPHLSLQTQVTAISGELTTLAAESVDGANVNWSLVQGPSGTSSFNSSIPNANIGLGIPGVYVFDVSSSLGGISSTQRVTIRVQAATFGSMIWGQHSWNAGEVSSVVIP